MTKAVQTRAIGVEMSERVNVEMNRLISSAPRVAEGEGLASMLNQILSAKSIEDLAGMGDKMDNGQSVAGKPMLITHIVARDSDIEDAPLGIYLTVHYEKIGRPGEGGAFNTGAVSMVAMLLTLHDRGWLPVAAHVEVKDLKGGNTSLNLVLD